MGRASLLELPNGTFVGSFKDEYYLLFWDCNGEETGRNTNMKGSTTLQGLTTKGNLIVMDHHGISVKSMVKNVILGERGLNSSPVTTACSPTKEGGLVVGYCNGEARVFDNKCNEIETDFIKHDGPIVAIFQVKENFVYCYKDGYVFHDTNKLFSWQLNNHTILDAKLIDDNTLVVLAKKNDAKLAKIVFLYLHGEEKCIDVNPKCKSLVLLKDGRIGYLCGGDTNPHLRILYKYDKIKLPKCDSNLIQTSFGEIGYISENKNLNFVKIPSMPIDVRKIIKARDMHFLYI